MDKERIFMEACRMVLLQKGWFADSVALISPEDIQDWLETYGLPENPTLLRLRNWNRAGNREEHELLAKIEDEVGTGPVSLPAFRCFLGLCKLKAGLLPDFDATDLSEYVELYCLALDTGERFLSGEPDELRFLQVAYKDELRAARKDDDLLFVDRGRFCAIISSILYFLWIFEPMRPALFRDWENQNKKVGDRMQLLVRKEGKNGNLFHNPVVVWRQENYRP